MLSRSITSARSARAQRRLSDAAYRGVITDQAPPVSMHLPRRVIVVLEMRPLGSACSFSVCDVLAVILARSGQRLQSDGVSTVVDLLEEVFETDKFKKLASRIEQGKVGVATIESFYQRWPMWASSVRIDASPGALTPFAFAAWRGHGSDNLAAAWPRLVGADDDGRAALHRVLLKHLLFCDAVAVPDPFVARDAPGSGFRIRVDGLVVDEESTRRWMARVLRSLESYADLVRAGVLRIVPAPELPEAREVVLLEDAMTDEEKGAFPDQPPLYSGISYAGQAAAGLLAQLRTANHFPALDPYFPTFGHFAVFRRMHEVSEGVKMRDHRPPTLAKFLACELPELIDLTMRDVVAIRQDGHFDRWRHTLAEGVRRYEDQVNGMEDLLSSSAAAMRSELSANLDQLVNEARADLAWLSKPTISTTIELILVGTSVAAALVAPPVAAGLAGAAAVPILARAFQRWRTARGALTRHVAVFR